MDDRTITPIGVAETPKYKAEQYDFSTLAVHEAWVISEYDAQVAKYLRVLAANYSNKHTKGKARFTVRKYKPFGATSFSIFVKRLPDHDT